MSKTSLRQRLTPPLTRGEFVWESGSRPKLRGGRTARRAGEPAFVALGHPYFEYNSTTNCSCAAMGMLGRCGRSSIRPENVSRSTASHVGD